jgi:hypothetical protein
MDKIDAVECALELVSELLADAQAASRVEAEKNQAAIERRNKVLAAAGRYYGEYRDDYLEGVRQGWSSQLPPLVPNRTEIGTIDSWP